MTEEFCERTAVALVAIPLALVLSVIMRLVAGQFHISTPGWLFIDWFLPGYRPTWLEGPAFYYLVLVDLAFCWAILLCVYWFVYSRFYDVAGRD